MSKSTLRACAGLALALALAAVTTPALGAGPVDDDVVRAAGVSEPRVVGGVDESAVPVPQSVADALAERVAAARAAEEAAALQRLAAAEDAAKLERLAAAIAAEEARQAEEARAAAVAPAPSSAPSGSIEELIHAYFGASGSKAVQVARCESGLSPGAVSPGGGNHGLFQINSVHQGTFESVTGAPWSAVYDAEANTRFAHWLWTQQGWGPWACA